MIKHMRLLILWCLLLATPVWSAQWQITYPRPLTEADQRTRYPVELLTLALDQTGVKYKLLPSDQILLQARALSELAVNRKVNVVWSMTNPTREQELLPIRIPVYKGLIGWRIFFIHRGTQSRFSGMNALAQLRMQRPIQGHDWPDTKILQSNGFDVTTSKDYLALFSLLSQEQGDFFPRSVVEIWSELDNEDIDASIVAEQTLGVRYPTAMYFFVNKRNSTLANLLQKGLEKAIANGSFHELFMNFHRPMLERANMSKRRFFELENPLLPAETPLQREELWYRPE